jgi:hypothetical protein
MKLAQQSSVWPQVVLFGTGATKFRIFSELEALSSNSQDWRDEKKSLRQAISEIGNRQ